MSVGVWVGLIALAGVDVETGVFMLLYLDLRGRSRAGEDELNGGAAVAVMDGAVRRIRPKIMTICAMVFGLLPIMWSTGNRLRRDEAHRRAAARRHRHLGDSRTAHLSGDFRNLAATLVAEGRAR